MDLEGRTAFITGAGGGIGTAVALALAARGVDVIAVDRDMDAAGATATSVGRTGREAIAVRSDVATNADVTAAVAVGLDRFGKIDICVNAVGVGGVARVVDHPDELWHQVISINLTSAFLVCRAVLPSMIDRGRGRIVNITSRAAYRSSAGTAAYAASKGGLLAFSWVLAVEAGEHGIIVNNVAPGTTLTPMVEKGIGGPEAQLREAVQSGVLIQPPRLADPSEIAAAVVFLCGPGSDFTTGTTLHVNGGAYCA
ncbi:MAG: SDR family oxidoreductase [Acidimicrobiales bacterium]